MSRYYRSFMLCLCALGALCSWPLAEPFERELPYVSTQDTQLKQAETLEQAGRYMDALPIYEKLVLDGSGRDSHWTAYVLFRLACAQYQIGDRVSAIESAGTAVMLDPSEPSYKAFQADVAAEQSGVKRSSVYHLRRDQGSARRLVSTNGVLHLFVRGRNSLPWEPEDEAKVRERIEESDRWVQSQAVESGLTAPVFEHRFLTLGDEPFWRRLDVPAQESSADYRKAWMDAVRVRFQSDSYAELFDREFNGMDLDNRAIVFHTSNRDLSLSILLPYNPQPTDLESVFVASEVSDWVNLYDAVTYTHEFLHLYGADDLFNKVGDPAIPQNEIMGYGGSRLESCSLSDVTRYAIGWATKPPLLTRLMLDIPTSHNPRKRGTHG